MEPYELEGRLVVVTGASSGIGEAMARSFAGKGARLVLVARREERLKALAAELEAANGTVAHIVPADLSVPGAAAAAASEIGERVGDVDVLVNNAGSVVGGAVWAVADSPEARANFEVDLWSPLALIGAFVPGMRRRGHGAVVNVTTIRQIVAWPAFGHSAAAKAALALATETLRLEMLRFGVRVVEVIPGPIDTAALGLSELLPGAHEGIIEPLGTATPSELAELTVRAVIVGEDRVFCPEATTRAVYEDPVGARARIEADVRRLLPNGSGLPDELLDTFIVGADNPLITDARATWERERTEAAS